MKIKYRKKIVFVVICIALSLSLKPCLSANNYLGVNEQHIFSQTSSEKCNAEKENCECNLHNQLPIVWEKFYNYHRHHDSGWKVQKTTDGGFIIVGYNSHKITTDVSAILLKVDENGNLQWKKQFGKPGLFEQFYSVVETSDGGYMLLGYLEEEDTSEFKLWLLKVNQGGTKIWEKLYGTESIGYSIQPTSDGCYIISGNTAVQNGVGVFLLKTDTDGNIIWENAFGHEGEFRQGFAVIQVQDGGYVIYGININSTYGFSDFLIKTDGAGNKIWEKQFGYETPFDWMFAGSIEAISNGNLLMVSTNCTQYDSDISLVKVNSQGHVLWQKNYGGNDFDFGIDVVTNSKNEHMILGCSMEYPKGTRLIKTDSEGNITAEVVYGGRLGYNLLQIQDDYIVVGELFDSITSVDAWLAKIIDTESIIDILGIGGGLGICVTIKNCGTEPVIDVPCFINIQDGILFLGRHYETTVDIIKPGEITSVIHSFLKGRGPIGFGIITIEVNIDYISKSKNAIIVGPFIQCDKMT